MTKPAKRDVDTSKFLAEVKRLGGTNRNNDAANWLDEARRIGLDSSDTAESLAWTCVDDELSNLEISDPRAAALTLNLDLAMSARPSLSDALRAVTPEHLGTEATDADVAAYRKVLARAWQDSPPIDSDEARILGERVFEGKFGEWLQR
jgi:hypothetical protein